MKQSPTKVRLFALWCILLGGLGQGIINPRLPSFLGAIDTLALASGISAALMYFGIFLTSFAYGRWADSGNAFRMLAIGLLVYALLLCGFTYSRSSTTLFILRFIEGITLSAVYVAADFILSRASTDEDRGRWLSLYGAALSIGLLLGPALLLITPDTNRALLSAAAVILLTGFFSFRFELPQLSSIEEWSGKLARTPLFFGALYGFLEAGLVAVFAVLLQNSFKVSAEYGFIAIILSAALSAALWGYAIDKRGPISILKLVFLFLFLGSGVLAYTKFGFSLSVRAYGSSILFGFIAAGLYPAAFTWLLEKVPANAYGRASAALTRAYGIGSLLGPLVMGVCTQFFGELGFFSVMISLGAVGLGTILVRSKDSRSS